MSAVHCVVVWEWQQGDTWLPHAPGVTRALERAHAKKLTRVVLADADPALSGVYVNLRTLTQYADTPDGGTSECRVRRACYSVQSAAGRGVRWEWARLTPSPQRLNFEPLPMEVQNLLESAWSSGRDSVLWSGWTLSATRGLARGGGGDALRRLHRAPAPPYPLARPPLQQNTNTMPIEGRRPRIPQQHTGSSVHSVQSMHSIQSVQSVQSVQSAKSVQSVQSAPARAGARSASPRERKPGLARQILHNLHIFSNTHKSERPPKPPPPEECGSTTDSTISNRRHSVDTISTYLSHESKESLQQTSVGSLLNCSAGSDDVFECGPPAPSDLARATDNSDVIIGADAEAQRVCVCVRVVRVVQWGAVCGVCVGGLAGGGVVALRGCHHMLHLSCLNQQLSELREKNQPLYIHCRVCGVTYGLESPPPPPPAPLPPSPPPPPAAPPQPPGSMAWRLQHEPLPQCNTPTIVVTYNFQSGTQGPQHPQPGAPYYAVGFPRYTLLPDTPLGRQVLSVLRSLWSAARLFTVCASLTTGREHVVAWCCPPPPQQPALYSPPTDVERLLQAALQRLTALQ